MLYKNINIASVTLPDLAQTLRDLAVQEWLQKTIKDIYLRMVIVTKFHWLTHSCTVTNLLSIIIYCCCISGGHVQEEQEKVEAEWKRQVTAYGMLRYPESNGYGNQLSIISLIISPLLYITPSLLQVANFNNCTTYIRCSIDTDEGEAI